MIAVHLAPYEVALAAHVGIRRQLGAMDRREAFGANGDRWTKHIEGACGELAVAKALRVYWCGSVGTFKFGGDVGALQVRTRSRLDYDLIVRPADPDEALFVLVVGVAPDFQVIGWIRGRDAKRAEWRAEHGGRPAAYFVPRAALHELTEDDL